jgi:hypothetical protein
MKRVYFIVFLLIFSLAKGQTTAVELSELNILYRGIKNQVKIAVTGVSQKNIVVKTNENIHYFKTSNEEYIKAVNKGLGTLTIGIVENKDTTWLKKREFRIRELPPPSVSFGSLMDDGKTKKKGWIMAQSGIFSSVGSSFAGTYRRCPFIGADFILIGEQIVHIKMEDNIFSPAIRRALRSLNDGDVIRVSNIKIIDPRTSDTLVTESIELVVGDGISSADKWIRRLNYIVLDKENVYKHNNMFTSRSLTDLDSIVAAEKNIIDGKINFFFSSTTSMYRIEKTYAKGYIIEEKKFDDFGNLTETIILEQEKRIKIK